MNMLSRMLYLDLKTMNCQRDGKELSPRLGYLDYGMRLSVIHLRSPESAMQSGTENVPPWVVERLVAIGAPKAQSGSQG